MTINTTDNRKEYAGNNVTVAFSFPYWFPANTDLVVLLVNDTTEISVTQLLTTNYIVTGADNSLGGTVTMIVAPASGETLVIYSDIAQTQALDLVERDEFPVGEVEKAFDRLTRISQRVKELILRATRMPESETSGLDMVLPALTTRKSKFGAWDAAGNWVAAAGTSANLGPVSAFIDTLLDDADAETARKTLEAMAGFKYVLATGTDTYASVNSPVHTSLITKVIYFANFANANTSATPTWAIDSIAAKTIVNNDGGALVAGQINGDHLLWWDGTNFRLLNPASRSSAFSVHRNGTDQLNVTGVDKILWTTEDYDTNGDFASNRFTPTIKGKYSLSVSVSFKSITDLDSLILYIYKNGSAHKATNLTASDTLPGIVAGVTATVTVDVDANGTTDYFEVFAQNSDRDTSDVNGDATDTYWTGHILH